MVSHEEERRPAAEPVIMLTVAEVAEILRIHPSQVTRLSHKGTIPAINLGEPGKRACFRYHPEEIAALQRRISLRARVEKKGRRR